MKEDDLAFPAGKTREKPILVPVFCGLWILLGIDSYTWID
jgi:hypothetical protein